MNDILDRPKSRALAFCLLFVPLLADAAGITGVTGSVSDRSTITISGSGFGTKPNGAKPFLYWNPGATASTNLDPNSRMTAWEDAPQWGSILRNQMAPNSVASYEVSVATTGSEAIIDGFAFTSDRLYLFNKWRVNFDGQQAYAQRADWNMKGWRWWYDDFSHDIVNGFADNEVNGNPRYYMENTSSGPSYAGMGLPTNAWMTEEWQMVQGDMDVSNANLKVFQNGKQTVNYADKSRTSGYPSKYNKLFSHQMERVSGPSTWKLWYDIVYVDDSWARVVVSDQPTWNTGASQGIEIQIPTAWSDTSITVVLRQGAFSSLAGKYLYVIGTSGQPVSTTGFQLCNDCKQPKPPSNIQTQ
jgi:hypothetical protein